MDSFTENILARARERQKLLKDYSSENDVNKLLVKKAASSEPNLNETTKENEIVPDCKFDPVYKENLSEGNIPKFSRQNSKTRVSSNIPGSPQSHLKTLNIQRDNFNMEIKLTSSENVRVEVEIEDQSDDDSGSHCSENGLREDAKNRLKRLGKLYAGGEEADISSPIHRSQEQFDEEGTESVTVRAKEKDDAKGRKGLSRLADLAQTINQWEDDVNNTNRPMSQNSTPKKTWKPPAPQPPKTSPLKASHKSKAPEPPKNKSPQKNNIAELTPSKERSIEIVGVTPKQLKWDKAVLDTLESQGFMRTTSSSRLVYSYNSQEENNKENENETNNVETNLLETITETKEIQIVENTTPIIPKSPSKNQTRTTCGKIAERAAIFESSPKTNNKSATTKDPALLTVSERKALFEKNKGEALVPKVAFAMSVPTKKTETPKVNKPAMAKNNENIKADPEKTPVKHNKPPAPKPPIQNQTTKIPTQSIGIASTMAALLENKSTISQSQIESNTREERQKEMDLLLNRFNKTKKVPSKEVVVEEEESDNDDCDDATEETAMLPEKTVKIIPSAPPMPPVPCSSRKSGEKRSLKASPKVAAVLEDVKRIRVSPPKAGKLYPNLSDIEATTETENENASPSESNNSSFDENISESDDANTSFGREILQAVCKNQTPQKRPICDESTASDVSSVLDEMDDYLNEALDTDSGPTPPKYGRQSPQNSQSAQPSHSFNYKNFNTQYKSPLKPSPKKSIDLPTYVVEGENVLPLTHTVSFYRKQQNEASKTPVRQISRQPIIEEIPQSPKSDDYELVQKKIIELQEEVNKQQMIISQTSQALNLCNCTPEFSGSTEQVEAEKVLLVSTHRRQAALQELQRLKVEGTIRPRSEHAQNLPIEKGTLTISNIVLPMKQKYVTALAATGGKGHHVVCLIKCGEQVLSTKLVSTVASKSKNPDLDLCIPGTIELKNIYSDFTITFEVYCLQAQEEYLPHEVKYHINNKKVSNKLTPKKGKQESRLIMPLKESPAGPQAVRSPSFALMGYVIFSVQAVSKRVWSLINTPAMSPLEGSVEMKIVCELAVSIEHRGFLTMFEDVSGFGAWHRRWCLLKGHKLSYWKYPDDERKVPPIDTIDLKNCITKEVGPVSRDICARLHTFLLERERIAYPQDKDTLVMVCKGDKTIIRHLLSADTKEERIEWCNKFNAALTATRMWGK